MKTIAIVTSGGDSPGMNAAIRAIVRQAHSRQIKVVGVIRGYGGILEGNFTEMNLSSVANIIQRGGTILLTDRCKEFYEASYRKEAANILRRRKIDGLIVIGGDGSFRGAHLLATEHQIPVIGIPGTIDNDIFGTDYTIGFDTAINTAIDAADKIRDTAGSLERTFLVEVMGKASAFIASEVGISVGAEFVVQPTELDPAEQIHHAVKRGLDRGKRSSIVVIAEGETSGRSYQIAEKLLKEYQIDSRVCVLGHIQRGGSPTARDRVAASRMGAKAVESFLNYKIPVMIGTHGDDLIETPLEHAFGKRREFKDELIRLASTLAT